MEKQIQANAWGEAKMGREGTDAGTSGKGRANHRNPGAIARRQSGGKSDGGKKG